jgi:hypothetical protein
MVGLVLVIATTSAGGAAGAAPPPASGPAVTGTTGAIAAPTSPGAPGAPAATLAVPVVPYQFIAKTYTELLGRAPDPTGWRLAVALFTRQGCDATSLQTEADAVLGGPEYRRDYPPGPASAPAVALTLYRLVLNREPDVAGFEYTRALLDSGTTTAAQAADDLFATPEFRTVTERAVCDPWDPDDGFGEPGAPTRYGVIGTPVTGAPGPDETGAQLETALERLSFFGGGTYSLPARQVVLLETTLSVPGNVTLTTAGDPGPNRYAQMARLVRGPFFSGLAGYAGRELVRLEPGAHLEHVWVDGQRDAADPNEFLVYDVRMLGGTGTTVRDDRIGNPYGASDLEADDNQSGFPGAQACAANVISDNLFDGYGSSHSVPAGVSGDHPEADGVGVYCVHTAVENNDFVDISDTAVALFDAAGYYVDPPVQESVVAHNVVVSAGNSYSFGIVTDPSFALEPPVGTGADPPGTVTRAFAGPGGRTRVIDNLLFGGTRTHYDVLLSAGSHDLFGSSVHPNCHLPNRLTGLAVCGGGRNATGATFIGNTDDGLGAQVEMGLYVGGTDGSVVLDNHFTHLAFVTGGSCPEAPAVVATGPGPGTFAPHLRIDQPFLSDRQLQSDSCVNPAF